MTCFGARRSGAPAFRRKVSQGLQYNLRRSCLLPDEDVGQGAFIRDGQRAPRHEDPFESMTRKAISLALLIGAAPSALLAQPAAAPRRPAAQRPATPQRPPRATPAPDDEDAEDIVVTGSRRPPGSAIGDIPPEITLNQGDIRSYGVGSVTELLTQLAPQTGSGQGRGGEPPVVLLNGHRISGLREIQDIPTEAIQRVEILPEEVALRYGYNSDQKVVNIVLRRFFRSTSAEASAGTSTAGSGPPRGPPPRREGGDHRPRPLPPPPPRRAPGRPPPRGRGERRGGRGRPVAPPPRPPPQPRRQVSGRRFAARKPARHHPDRT